MLARETTVRVLLVQTKTAFDEPPIFPLGLAYLGASLIDAGHAVHTYDANIGFGRKRDLQSAVTTVNPDVIGVSIRNIKNARPGIHISTIQEHQQTIHTIRNAAPSTPIVAGGPGFSLYGNELMHAIPDIDLGVFGEGEETFPELLDNLEDPQKIHGIFSRDDGNVLFSGRRRYVEVDGLTRPARHLFDVRAYAREPMGIAVQAKRGCALDCIHCSNHHLFERNLRIRDPEDVVNEIQELVDYYSVQRFMFADEIFNLPRHHANRIAEELLKRGIKAEWTGWFKESELDEESVRLWKRAGLRCLYFSPDVVSDELLGLWGKGVTEDDLYHAVQVLRRCRVNAEWNFMINGPGESVSSLSRLVRFITWGKLRLGRRFRLNGCFVLVVRIYPHTRLQEYAIRHDIIAPDDDLLEPTYFNPPPLSVIVKPTLAALGLAWRIRQLLRLMKNPATYRD